MQLRVFVWDKAKITLLWSPRCFLKLAARLALYELLWLMRSSWCYLQFSLPFARCPVNPQQDRVHPDRERLCISRCHLRNNFRKSPYHSLARRWPTIHRWLPYGHLHRHPSLLANRNVASLKPRGISAGRRGHQALQGCDHTVNSTLSAFSAVFSWQMADCDTTIASPA